MTRDHLVLAVDPGPERSAYALYNATEHTVVDYGITDTVNAVQWLPAVFPGRASLAIEMIASYGMPVGREVFETCVWIGRLIEAWERNGAGHALVYRRDVKLHLCGDSRAKDGNVRQALLDLFPRTGGGKTPQVGTKAKPGPLFGVAKDIWAALGVAVTYAADPRRFVEIGA